MGMLMTAWDCSLEEDVQVPLLSCELEGSRLGTWLLLWPSSLWGSPTCPRQMGEEILLWLG